MAAHEVVLFGATGFTGRLVAEELARRDVRWAMAGRRRDALERARDELGVDVPIVVADASDLGALRAMASEARVVCTTVGPYSRHGEPLVEACVAEGTHYCDLAGEPHFVRRMVTRFHDLAASCHVRIVHACGFDSVPSDLGCFLLQEAAIARAGAPAREVRLYVRRLRGAFSGGTIESLMASLEQRRDPEVRAAMRDPYALVPGASGPPVRDLTCGVDHADGSFLAPFVMAPTNARVVRRTNALLGWRYGNDFRYDEVSSFRGASGAVRAFGLTAGLLAFGAAVSVRPTRDLARRLLPGPSEGPGPEQRQRGRFEMELVAREPEEVRVVVGADRDPGYAGTAIMLAESALCLARDPLPDRFGVLTPASAMGHALVDRLRRAGFRFEVRPPPAP